MVIAFLICFGFMILLQYRSLIKDRHCWVKRSVLWVKIWWCCWSLYNWLLARCVWLHQAAYLEVIGVFLRHRFSLCINCIIIGTSKRNYVWGEQVSSMYEYSAVVQEFPASVEHSNKKQEYAFALNSYSLIKLNLSFVSNLNQFKI